jgi:hypothetical protein
MRYAITWLAGLLLVAFATRPYAGPFLMSAHGPFETF